MSNWSLAGVTPGYAAVVSGTVTLPPDATILMISASAAAGGATVSIFGGAAIPVPTGGPLTLPFFHRLFASQGTGSAAQVVFTGTSSGFVHWCRSGNS
jgi:hypothetical protein